jgi:CheY-like chemotaxis protein
LRSARDRIRKEEVEPLEELDLITEGQGIEVPLDELSHLLDDLTGTTTPLELDLEGLDFMNDAASTSSIDSSADVARGVKEPEAGSQEAQPSIPDDSVPPRLTQPRAVRNARQPEPLGEAEVHAKNFNVLIIQDDPETNDLVTRTLDDYSVEVARDGVSGLAKLISFKPDLVVLDFDLPVSDGFKVLGLIRSSLNVPIIIVSGSRMRALDRVMASELGADYYLTKPFSANELKHKARQLIARYRGISSWITTPLSKGRGVSAGGSQEAGSKYASKRSG